MKAIQRAAYAAANTLRQRFVGDTGYGLAYGSHPSGTATHRSDLDLVLVSPQPLAADELVRLIDAICHLHERHGFDLDTEVDYAVKVYASFADVDAAVRLHCFDRNSQDGLAVPPVTVEPWFLNSRTFAHRLVLNALTSPHVFLGGTVATYTQHRRRAEYALALIAMSLRADATTLTLEEAAGALTHGPNHTSGEDFLGYTDTRHLLTTLRRGLAHLAREGILRDLDGTTFRCDHDACRAAIQQLQPARRVRGSAWNNAH